MIIAGEHLKAGDWVVVKDGIATKATSTGFILAIADRHGWKQMETRQSRAICFRKNVAEITYWPSTRTIKVRQVINMELKYRFIKRVTPSEIDQIFENENYQRPKNETTNKS